MKAPSFKGIKALNINRNFPIGHPERYPVGRYNTRFIFQMGRYYYKDSSNAIIYNKRLENSSNKLAANYSNNKIKLNESYTTEDNEDYIITLKYKKFISGEKMKVLKENNGNVHVLTYMFEHNANQLSFCDLPFIVKPIYGSKGYGVKLLNNAEEFLRYVISTPDLYLSMFEEFFDKDREYRLHISTIVEDKVFFAQEKKVKKGYEKPLAYNKSASDAVTFSSNFIRPPGWDIICKTCIDLTKLLQLDLVCLDLGVKITGNKVEYFIFEVNTQPHLENKALEEYRIHLRKVLTIVDSNQNTTNVRNDSSNT